MAKQLFKTTNGIEIFLTEDGKFTAKISGREASRNSLREIEKLIEKTLTAVELYELSRYSGGPHKPAKREIIAFEKDRARHKNGDLDRYGTKFHILTDEDLRRAQEFVERDEKIHEEWSEFVGSLLKVDHRNFEEIKKKASGSDG